MALSRDRSVPLSTLGLGLYLLGILLLLLGVVGSQANINTEDLFRLSNQTVTATTNGNGTIPNVTLSNSELNDLKVDDNMTLITEDNEGFQDWENELRPGQCHKGLLRELCHYCGEVFRVKMMSVSKDKWCSMEEIIWPYNEMSLCLEELSSRVGCFYPNPTVQELFLQIHSDFFSNCTSPTSPALEDAPHGVVLTLTLIPVSLIPALVYVVILKNKAHK